MRNPFSTEAWSWRALPAIAVAVVLLGVAKPSVPLFLAALPLVSGGEALRMWAAGHLHKTRELVVSGPYAHLRHPLYAGTLLVATGFCLMGGPLVAAIALPVLLAFFFAYYLPYKERREAGRLARRHGEVYAAYRAGVPALVPRLTPWQSPVGREARRWSASRVRENDEVGTALALAVGLTLVCAHLLAVR